MGKIAFRQTLQEPIYKKPHQAHSNHPIHAKKTSNIRTNHSTWQGPRNVYSVHLEVRWIITSYECSLLRVESLLEEGCKGTTFPESLQVWEQTQQSLSQDMQSLTYSLKIQWLLYHKSRRNQKYIRFLLMNWNANGIAFLFWCNHCAKPKKHLVQLRFVVQF